LTSSHEAKTSSASSRAPSPGRSALQALVDDVLKDVGHGHNPYLGALSDGELSKGDFIETQLQFHGAVVFFSRPMAALAGKISDAHLRTAVVRNVWEEHGEGDATFAHGHTFETFLSRIMEVTVDDVKAELAARPMWPEVRAFNTVLVGACVVDDALVGAGTMGIIERMFADISAWIGRGVVARGWLEASRMIHYNLHEELDAQHAADFFDVLAHSWDNGAEDRRRIEQGLRMGAAVFDQLYAQLWQRRARRWRR
jgi:pyrroloquinoline-quinone synthase